MLNQHAIDLACAGACGKICIATAADRTALAALYFAVFPYASQSEIADAVSDSNLIRWAFFRNAAGEIPLAVIDLRDGGAIQVLVHPDRQDTLEVEFAFLALTEHIRRGLGEKPPPAILPVWLPDGLEKFGEMIEKRGITGSPTWRARYLTPIVEHEDHERPTQFTQQSEGRKN